MSHVFRGTVRVEVVGAKKGLPKLEQVLHANESALVDGSEAASAEKKIVVTRLPERAVSGFVRELPRRTSKWVSLVDLMTGDANGKKMRQGIAIHPGTGETSEAPFRASPTNNDYAGDGKYHRVKGCPVVDGVFIPQGKDGPVQIDSAGGIFDGFPVTANATADCFWAGGAYPSKDPHGNDPAMLDGIDYSSAGHRWIYLHANKGITFDLNAIRRTQPRGKLVKLQALVGNSERLSANGQNVLADLWVLVDGQVRYRYREINSCNGALPLTVPLREKDRFLTFVATDGGNGIGFDWIVVGDPRLEWVVEEPKSGK
jgi:hypothetical protein